MADTPSYRLLGETEDYLVIHKAPEVSFHDDGADHGLVRQLKADLQRERLYPVHRLDKMTSGLLLFGKTVTWTRTINEQFRTHQVEKYYLALSDRKPKKKQGMICGDMVKTRRGSWKLQASRENPALTQFFSFSAEAGLRLFLLRPLTGRTHQLRVAMKSLGAPILGDGRYGGSLEGVDRGYLHAYALRFCWQGHWVEWHAPPVDGEWFGRASVQRLIDPCSSPWRLQWPKPPGPRGSRPGS